MGGDLELDAAVAATLALGVVEPHLFGLGGEVTGLVHLDGRTRVLAGATRAPAAMTLEAFGRLGLEVIPGDGLLAAGPPAVMHALLLLLAEHGTASLSTVAGPAAELAEDGFEVGAALARAIASHEEHFRELWPTSGEVWMPSGQPPRPGERIRQPALAETLRRLGRAYDEGGPDAALGELRTGFVAKAIIGFAAEPQNSSVGIHASFLHPTDLAGSTVRWEEPISWTDRRGWTIYKAGPWTQGPLLLEHLAIMQAGSWDGLPVQSPDFLHATIESLKLAFADREGYLGDPDFVDVPLPALHSSRYAIRRSRLVDMERVSDPGPGLAEPGRTPWKGSAAGVGTASGDTTHLDVADGRGTLIALTPSGGWFASPVVPDLGFPLGTRCQTFWLDPAHPNVLAPGKRPRTPLTPTLIFEEGRPRYALGTPGGDLQEQIQAQIIHALAQGLTPEEAVELATVVTRHPLSSFFPHGSEPQVVWAEGRLGEDALGDLLRRGHLVIESGPWNHGRPQVLEVTESGRLRAAASRRVGTAAVGAR